MTSRVSPRHPALERLELVGGRLYTGGRLVHYHLLSNTRPRDDACAHACAHALASGPMYEKYNVVLRSRSRNAYLVRKYEDQCRGNDYVTTIHAVRSTSPHPPLLLPPPS